MLVSRQRREDPWGSLANLSSLVHERRSQWENLSQKMKWVTSAVQHLWPPHVLTRVVTHIQTCIHTHPKYIQNYVRSIGLWKVNDGHSDRLLALIRCIIREKPWSKLEARSHGACLVPETQEAEAAGLRAQRTPPVQHSKTLSGNKRKKVSLKLTTMKVWISLILILADILGPLQVVLKILKWWNRTNCKV